MNLGIFSPLSITHTVTICTVSPEDEGPPSATNFCPSCCIQYLFSRFVRHGRIDGSDSIDDVGLLTVNLKKTVGKNVLLWPLAGALLGGWNGGTIALLSWLLIPSKGPELPFPLASATDVFIVASIFGFGAGAITAWAGGLVTTFARANPEEVADTAIFGSVACGASLGLGIVAPAVFKQNWVPILVAFVGAGTLVLRNLMRVLFQVARRRLLPPTTICIRFALGLAVGCISGLLTECIMIGVIILTLSSEIAVSLIGGFAGIVGPMVGIGTGGAVAVGISGAGGSSRRAAWFAIEASLVATLASSIGIFLVDFGLGTVGIAVAASTTTIWSVTRGRLIRLPNYHEQRSKRNRNARRLRIR